MTIGPSAKNKIGFIDGSIKKPQGTDEKLSSWKMCNDMVLSWILNSIEPDLANRVIYAETAEEVWTALKERFTQNDIAPRIFQIERDIASLQQGSMSVASYFTKLKGLWDELSSYNKLPVCTCGASKKVEEREQRAKVMPLSTGTRAGNRQALSVVIGGHDQHPTSGPPSVAGSDSGVIELTKENVLETLNEKLRIKNKYNHKEISQQRLEYIKRLKQCVKWLQQREGDYITEQEKLKNLLEFAEKQFHELESLMKAKEEELNSIIMELRKNLDALQEKFTKEESAKMEVLDSLAREKDSRVALERLKTSISEELKRTQDENASSNQKIQSLNDTRKRLQEYNTCCKYNSKLQSELAATNDLLRRVEKEKAAVHENLSTLRGYYTSMREKLSSSK